MTKCQQYFPTDPSHSVDFSRAVHQPDSVEEDDSGPVQRKVEFTSAKATSPDIAGLALWKLKPNYGLMQSQRRLPAIDVMLFPQDQSEMLPEQPGLNTKDNNSAGRQ